MTKDKTTELLPCPFCGEQPVFANVPNAPEVYCEDCDCASVSGDTQEEVYELWNTRPSDNSLIEENKRLRLHLETAVGVIKSDSHFKVAYRDSIFKWEQALSGKGVVNDA